MTQSFRLPDLGEGLTEAELVTWLVEVGDTVELNQVIAEVETAKASVELPSPYAGTVTALRAEAGTTVEVGTPIIDISDGDGSGPVAEEPAQDEERIPVLVGYGVAGEARGQEGIRAGAHPCREFETTGLPAGAVYRTAGRHRSGRCAGHGAPRRGDPRGHRGVPVRSP